MDDFIFTGNDGMRININGGREDIVPAEGDGKRTVEAQRAAADRMMADDVLCSGQTYEGRLAYTINLSNSAVPRLPSGYDVIVCDHPSTHLGDLVGLEAVVCLDDGQLLFRQIMRSRGNGRYDLCDRHAEPRTIICAVRPRWAAALACGVARSQWKKMEAAGLVQNATNGLH